MDQFSHCGSVTSQTEPKLVLVTPLPNDERREGKLFYHCQISEFLKLRTSDNNWQIIGWIHVLESLSAPYNSSCAVSSILFVSITTQKASLYQSGMTRILSNSIYKMCEGRQSTRSAYGRSTGRPLTIDVVPPIITHPLESASGASRRWHASWPEERHVDNTSSRRPPTGKRVAVEAHRTQQAQSALLPACQ